MKVLYVASEALPFMASGGLGDVAGSLATYKTFIMLISCEKFLLANLYGNILADIDGIAVCTAEFSAGLDNNLLVENSAVNL